MNEQDFLDTAALTAFGALLNSSKGGQSFAKVANQAIDAAHLLLTARQLDREEQYMSLLRRYIAEPLKALRRILSLDGNSGAGLDSVMRQYANKPDPLRTYAQDTIGSRKTAGQTAITRFLKDNAPQGAAPGNDNALNSDGALF